MKRTVVFCDYCAKPAGDLSTPLVFEFPKARACAEDDATYTETVDLCPGCASGLLIRLLIRMPLDQKRDLGRSILDGRKGGR